MHTECDAEIPCQVGHRLAWARDHTCLTPLDPVLKQKHSLFLQQEDLLRHSSSDTTALEPECQGRPAFFRIAIVDGNL